jgi:cellulose synthase/poly-beta-1,6-N-acetylglucosamine synthase-like glycosyltransferase
MNIYKIITNAITLIVSFMFIAIYIYSINRYEDAHIHANASLPFATQLFLKVKYICIIPFMMHQLYLLLLLFNTRILMKYEEMVKTIIIIYLLIFIGALVFALAVPRFIIYSDEQNHAIRSNSWDHHRGREST